MKPRSLLFELICIIGLQAAISLACLPIPCEPCPPGSVPHPTSYVLPGQTCPYCICKSGPTSTVPLPTSTHPWDNCPIPLCIECPKGSTNILTATGTATCPSCGCEATPTSAGGGKQILAPDYTQPAQASAPVEAAVLERVVAGGRPRAAAPTGAHEFDARAPSLAPIGGQCGGIGHAGTRLCESKFGSTVLCVYVNDYYSQCQIVEATSKKPSTTSSPTPTNTCPPRPCPTCLPGYTATTVTPSGSCPWCGCVTTGIVHPTPPTAFPLPPTITKPPPKPTVTPPPSCPTKSSSSLSCEPCPGSSYATTTSKVVTFPACTSQSEYCTCVPRTTECPHPPRCTCPPGYTLTSTSTGTACPWCSCAFTDSSTGIITMPTVTTTRDCPTYSCPGCGSGSYITLTTSGTACPGCGCAAYPTTKP